MNSQSRIIRYRCGIPVFSSVVLLACGVLWENKEGPLENIFRSTGSRLLVLLHLFRYRFSESVQPYSSSRRYKVLRSIFRMSATAFLFPSVSSMPAKMYSRSISASDW